MSGGTLHTIARPTPIEPDVARTAPTLAPGERDALLTRIDELERLLADAERTARFARLAGDVGHEIRGPLHAARGFAELLERHSSREGHERRWAARVVDALGEVEELASSVLSIAARRPLSCDAVDPDELVADAIAGARRALDGRGAPERWTLVKHVDSPRFAGDRIKLRAALRDLVGHALHALPDGGRVDVHVRLDGGEIEIAVHDSGSGVPAQESRRLDEPYFGSQSEHAGLGLVLARAITELHGGRFAISASPGPLGGAVISLRLPYEPR